jgi:hypothetical protein
MAVGIEDFHQLRRRKVRGGIGFVGDDRELLCLDGAGQARYPQQQQK